MGYNGNMNAHRDITWSSEEPTPYVEVPARRTDEEINELVESLQSNPGRWAVFSSHKTRNAARQRLTTLRQSPTYRQFPLTWRTRRTIKGDTTAPVEVLVCWDPAKEHLQT